MKIRTNILILTVVLTLFLAGSNPLLAFVMESTNYQMQADDALTTSGSDYASANYVFQDTMGEVSTGRSDSSTYKLKAGYLEMLETYIAVSAPADADLTPAIPGITGGTADASIAWNVIADSPAGFDMSIKASATPAMKLPPEGTYYFDDYSTTPSYSWAVSSNEAKFGFTIEPATAADTATAFLDNGSNACGTGSANNSDTCWSGFNGTTEIPLISRTSRTDLDGESETVKFKAQSNAKFMQEGNYNAIVTVLVATN